MRILDKNRAKYNHNYVKNTTCPFCADDEVLSCKGLTSASWRVLVNRFPYMDGNVMIIPTRHVEQTNDLTPEEWVDFGIVLARTQEVLKKIFKLNSFNIGMNLGPESGASIAHLHWQVIPRKFKNITVANTFADLYIVSVTPEETKRLIDEETIK